MELPPQMLGKWSRNLASSFPKCRGIATELPQTAEESGTRAGRAQREDEEALQRQNPQKIEGKIGTASINPARTFTFKSHHKPLNDDRNRLNFCLFDPQFSGRFDAGELASSCPPPSALVPLAFQIPRPSAAIRLEFHGIWERSSPDFGSICRAFAAEVPCGFSCPSAPLPLRHLYFSSGRRCIREGVIDERSQNRGLRRRLDAAERAMVTRSRRNIPSGTVERRNLLFSRRPELDKRPLVYTSVNHRKVAVPDFRTSFMRTSLNLGYLAQITRDGRYPEKAM
jgi:hypothetical protein